MKLPAKAHDLAGQRFGRLKVVSYAGARRIGEHTRPYWRCVCDCGNVVTVQADNLRSSSTKSCGCLRRSRFWVHGDARTPAGEWIAWQNMRQRCRNPKNISYEYYGARGIKVCSRWLNNYQNFLADVGRKPSPEHSLERINNNGDYQPGNVRWATPREQSNNRRPRTKKGNRDG